MAKAKTPAFDVKKPSTYAVQLKNIKIAKGLSRESTAYTASLYFEGKKIGDVHNEGCGGPDGFYGDWEKFREAEAWIKANVAGVVTEHFDYETDVDMDFYCSYLIDLHECKAAMKRESKKTFLAVDANGALTGLSFKTAIPTEKRAVWLAMTRGRNPELNFLEDIKDEDERLLAFVKANELALNGAQSSGPSLA